MGDICSIKDLRRNNTNEDAETQIPKYSAGDILREEISVIGAQKVEVQRCKYKVYYDSRDTEKKTMMHILQAIRKI